MHPLPVSEVSFESLLNLLGRLYDVIWTSAYMIWVWLGSPVDENIVEFLPDLAGSSNLELIFGSALIGVLVFAVVKFFTPLM